MAQSKRGPLRRTLAAGLLLAGAGTARADYVGDLVVNSGATVWTEPQTIARIANPAGASILNTSQVAGTVVENGGVIRNAPDGTWNGDLDLSANRAGAALINEGRWNGTLRNAGGDIENAGVAASANNAAGLFVSDGALTGDLINAGRATNNGAVAGRVVNGSVFVNNAAGSVAGGLIDSGATTNNGAIAGGVRERGGFVNNASGRVSGGLALDGGGAVNNGAIEGGVRQSAGGFVDNGLVRGGATLSGGSFTVNGALEGGAVVAAGRLLVNSAGTVRGDVASAGALDNAGTIRGGVGVSGAFVNNGAVEGPVGVAATGSVANNGRITGIVANAGTFTGNATGVAAGGLVNSGLAEINGTVAGGAVNRGRLTINDAGRLDGGLVVEGGAAVNAGTIAGGATVRAGALASTGRIEGGLDASGFVRATGALAGPVRVSGELVVGAAPGGVLALAPGSSLSGAVTVPVDLADGRAGFLAARGSDVSGARLDLAGSLANPKGAYWGRLSLSDAPIALTPAARAALAAASGPLYAYADSGEGGIAQTINPGLGATAAHIAAAASLGVIKALEAPPEAGPEGVSVWARGVATRLGVSGENSAGSGPAFGAARFTARLAGAEAGLGYRISAWTFGLSGGELAGGVAAAQGSGAVRAPFLGAYAAVSAGGLSIRLEARALALDMRLTDAGLAVFDQSQRAAGFGYVASASYRLNAGALSFTPEAGISQTRLRIADEATNVGALTFGRADLTLAHAGLRIGAEASAGGWRLQPYAFTAIWRGWRSGAIEVPQGPIIAPTGLAGFEQVGLGVEASLARAIAVSVQGEGLFGPRVSGLSASAALRWRF